VDNRGASSFRGINQEIVNLQTALIIVVGFLVGMIPAMLLIGFLGGRQVEKHRKELKLQYERQVTALRATIQRMMQRIDLLTDERNRLKQSNRGLRESLQDQNRATDQANSKLNRNRADLARLQERAEALAADNLRHEGRLEESRLNQERMEVQFTNSVAQFAEVERLRSRLLFATNQLQEARTSNQALEDRLANLQPGAGEQTQYGTISSDQLDVSVIDGLEPVYVERLHDSGIHTIADLANQTPARVAHFAGLASWDESSEWIDQAKALLAAASNNDS
jgi:predicted flap endonuclease-1-like 5' DNA nuclease